MSRNGKYDFHPAAAVFPLMDEDSLQLLADDIKQHGLRDAIELLDEKIIDGRNRYLACKLAGVVADFVGVEELGDPTAYVVSQNLHRRQLKTSQRAMCAAKAAGLPNGVKKSAVQNCTASDDAATVFQVSRRSVMSALDVLRNGCKELISLCESGQLSVNAACKLIETEGSKRDQAAIARQGAKAVRDHVKGQAASKPAKRPASAITLPESPSASDVAAVDRWLEKQDERPVVERFRALWDAADSVGRAAICAAMADITEE